MDIRNGESAKATEAELRKQIKSGKISNKKIKDFLKNYYDGDPACNGCPTGCKDPEQCYIDIHLALIDDSGAIQPFKVKYTRDGVKHCCGRPLQTLGKSDYCTICGNEY